MTLPEVVDAFTGLFKGELSAFDLIAVVFGAIFVGIWLFEGRSFKAQACFAVCVSSMFGEAWLNGDNVAGIGPVRFVLGALIAVSLYSLAIATVRSLRPAAPVAQQQNPQRAGEIDVV